MEVSSIMTCPAWHCYAEHSLNEAAHRMWTHAVGALPVVDFNHRPIAMVTDRDICMAAYTQGQLLAEMLVRSAMSKSLHFCYAHDDVDEVARAMSAHELRRFPVINDMGSLVGLVSRADIARSQATASFLRAPTPFVFGARAFTGPQMLPTQTAKEQRASR